MGRGGGVLPPTFTDSEVIPVALLIDTFFHGQDALGLAFLRQYEPTLFPALPADGHFNDRRRALGSIIEQRRRHLTTTHGLIAADDPWRLMDRAPLPVCTYGRGGTNATLAGPEYFSVMASRKAKLFGLRLYLTTTSSQVADRWMLAPAAPHAGKMMHALLADEHDLIVLADGAFQDPTEMEVLQRKHNIQVSATPRKDSQQPCPTQVRQWVTRLRRRIETALSVLVPVCNVEQLHARSLTGIVTRIATRLLAYNLCLVMKSYLAQLSPNTPN